MDTVNLGELFTAMALARQEFNAFTKSKTATIKSDKGSSYGYSYADLSDIIEAIAPALAKHGLVIIQEPEVIGTDGRQVVVISGCIAHKSGAVYQFRPLPLPVVGSTAQAIGSAISYARRYQLTSLFNLAASDDDGEAAQSGNKSAKAQDNPFENTPAPVLSLGQLKELAELGTAFYGEEWKQQQLVFAEKVSKGAVKTILELNPGEADKLIDGIKKKVADVEAAKAAKPEAVAS